MYQCEEAMTWLMHSTKLASVLFEIVLSELAFPSLTYHDYRWPMFSSIYCFGEKYIQISFLGKIDRIGQIFTGGNWRCLYCKSYWKADCRIAIISITNLGSCNYYKSGHSYNKAKQTFAKQHFTVCSSTGAHEVTSKATYHKVQMAHATDD